MMERQFQASEPELMDRLDASPAELDAALRSLRGLNRWFGSYHIIAHFIRRWIKPDERLRIADLCTGSADIPRYIADHARRVGAQVEITAVDFHPVTIETAQRFSADYPEIKCVQADVLTFNDAPFDIVICSLALHHFADEDAVRLLRRARELSNGHVLISDLRRSVFAILGVHLLTTFLFADCMTRHDGRASVRRAFTLDELRDLARLAGWENFGGRTFRFARQAIWIG